jgi:transcriptional regulator of acetoin/glycerol metabolism
VLKTVAFMSDNAMIAEEDLPPDFLAERASAGGGYEESAVATEGGATPSSDPRVHDAIADGAASKHGPAANQNAFGALTDWERQAVLTALSESAWNVSSAARRLDITRSTLYQKISKYGIKKPNRSW